MSGCPACGSPVPAGAKFCPECAAPQARTCTGCGSPLPAGAKFCPECATPVAGAAPGSTGGSAGGAAAQPVAARRMTSVLFGDLVGFTTLSESRDQEEVRELLSRYFDACRTVIQRYGGTVEKFIGDAVMAVWGVPIAHEDDAERAVRAGLELLDAVAALRDEVGVPGLDMRIGIVTGEVAVTIGAVAQGMVAGDPVNTASRVQSVASPGQVWVDETTRLLTHAAITFEDVGSFVLKGKADPVPLWAARAVVANVGGGQRADGLEAPLVGRVAELRLVKEVFHRTEETQSPNVLLVSADPGLGKSRLGWEFSKYTDGLSSTVRWLEGRCPAYGDGLAFHALAEALRGRLRSRAVAGAAGDATTAGGDDGLDLGRLLDDLLAEFVADPGQRQWLRSRVAVLLGLPGAGSHPRDELFAAWVTLLEHLAADASSVVLVIDDAQHADDGLLDFVEFALTARGLPLFVLMLTRPELLSRRPTLMANPRVVTAHLQELSTTEVEELLSALVVGLPDTARQSLAVRAEGVPLFAVETVRSLIDRDLVVPQGGRYVLADPDADLSDLAPPASLQALVASRLDALPPAQRRVVDVASVLGRSFSPTVLPALVDDPGLDDLLGALVRRQVLSVETNRLAGEFGWYAFTQDVVRQVAYGMLSRRDRQEAHLAVVAALGDPPADADLPVVAHHLLAAAEAVPGGPEEAALGERALHAFVAAGEWAGELSSHRDAVAHFQHAADLAGDPARRADLLCRAVRSCLLASTAELDAVGEAAGVRAQELFAMLGDEDGQARAVGLTATLLAQHGQVRRADELVGPWWERYRDREDVDATLVALTGAVLGIAIAGGGSHDLTRVSLLGAKAAERIGDTRQFFLCLQGVGAGLEYDGYPELAGIVMSGAARHAERRGDLRGQALVLGNLGSAQMGTDLVLAEQSIRQGRQTNLELRLQGNLATDGYNLCVILWLRGDWAEFDELAADHEQLAFLAPLVSGFSTWSSLARGEETTAVDVDAVADDPASHAILRIIENVRRGMADPADREAVVASAAELLASFGHAEEFTTGLGLATEALVHTDERSLEGLLEVTSELPEHRLQPATRAHRLRAAAMLALLRAGATPDVADQLEAAVTAYRKWGATLFERRTQADLAKVLDQLGRHDEAAALRAEVRAFYSEIGATAWLAELDAPIGVGASGETTP